MNVIDAKSTLIKKNRNVLPYGSVSSFAISIASIAIFGIDAGELYDGGNVSYITLPAAVLLSLGIFLLTLKAVEMTGGKTLYGMFERAVGRLTAVLIAAVLTIALELSSVGMLRDFTEVLHGLFFEGAGNVKLILYLLAPILVIALLGFETLVRTSRIYTLVLASALALTLLSAMPEFRLYRLFPFPGKSFGTITRETLSAALRLSVPLICLLVHADSFENAVVVRRIGIRASLFSACAVCIVQLSTALSFTYSQLRALFMPFFRITHLSMFEAHFIRFDKLVNITALNGALLTSALTVTTAGKLASQCMRLKKSVVPVAVLTLLLGVLTLSGTLAPGSAAANSVYSAATEIGTIVIPAAAVLLLVSTAAAGLKFAVRSRKERRQL